MKRHVTDRKCIYIHNGTIFLEGICTYLIGKGRIIFMKIHRYPRIHGLYLKLKHKSWHHIDTISEIPCISSSSSFLPSFHSEYLPFLIHFHSHYGIWVLTTINLNMKLDLVLHNFNCQETLTKHNNVLINLLAVGLLGFQTRNYHLFLIGGDLSCNPVGLHINFLHF